MNSTPSADTISTLSRHREEAPLGPPPIGVAGPLPFVERESKIQGRGAFAIAAIPAGARVVEYVGERISKAESLRRCQANNQYIFALDDQFDLDGNVAWNPARFLNHSCRPNCEALWQDGHIYISALGDICAGQELTFNYGYDLADYQEHPCRCGSPGCVGFMVAEEFFPTLRRTMPAANPRPI